MQICIRRGDIFKSPDAALVNPVNCKGVMGAGRAQRFRNVFPRMYEDYRSVCSGNGLRPGTIHTYAENGKIIVNLPAKDDFRKSSQLRHIRSGVAALAQWMKRYAG